MTVPCAEPAELVGSEVGDFNPTWGDFLDAPTLVDLPEFTDTWMPTGPPAGPVSGCLAGVEDFSGPIDGLEVRRLAHGLVVAVGFLAPGVSGLEVVAPRGPRFAAAVDPESHAFLAPIGSLGVRNEAELIAIRGHHAPAG